MPPTLSFFKFASTIWALCGSTQLLRNMYSDVGWNVLEISIRYNWLMLLFSSLISLLISCVLVLAITGERFLIYLCLLLVLLVLLQVFGNLLLGCIHIWIVMLSC